MANERKIDVVILGLLSHEPMSGYDIKKQIDKAIRFFWKGSFGSIYPSLNTMEKEKLVEKESVIENGRTKIWYSITREGHQKLQEWLSNSQAKDELKYETLLKLFFGGAVDKKMTLRTIEEFADKVAGQLAILNIYKDNLEKCLDEEDHLYYYLTVSFGVEMYMGHLKWCEQAKKILKDR